MIDNRQEMPRRVSLFWYGRMSWMRYLTLWSLRKCNPGWEILLYRPAEDCIARTWDTHEQDDRGYQGVDYSDRVDQLSVQVRRWTSPVGALPPAHACDVFQWQFLGNEGGFYCDMDVLWLQPLEPVRQQVLHADAMFCLENGVLAIGFLAGQPGCRLFRDLDDLARASAGRRYQNYGTELVFKLLGTGHVGGDTVLRTLQRRYSPLRIRSVPGETVYPFDWRETSRIFYRSDLLPPGCRGIHWFGGDKLSHEQNMLLTEENWRGHRNTFTDCLRRLMP